MKKLFPLCLLFISFVTNAQTERRGNFAIVPSLGINTSIFQPAVTVFNGPYVLQRETVENPECYDDYGNLVDCDKRNYHAGLGFMYRIANKNGTGGWTVFANGIFQQQTYMLNYPDNRNFRIPVACTPSIMRLLRSAGASVSLGKYWDVGNSDRGLQLIARMGATAAGNFKYKRGNAMVKLPDLRALNYVSSGNGTIIEMYDNTPKYNILLTPEFGIQEKNFPLELVVSVNIPIVNKIVFSELHTFAENNHIAGQNRVDYTNAVFNITGRYRLDFKSKPRKIKEPRYRPEAERRPSPIVYPVTDNSRFGRGSEKEPMRLNVFFDLEKAILGASSFKELDELSKWLHTYPLVKIRLEGHTDLIGEASANQILSQKRVEAVKNYLTNRGVNPNRIEVRGFGETRPISRNCPPPNYCPENRRVEMVVLKR